MADEKVRSIDKATLELLDKAKKENILTVFDRAEAMKPCPIGVEESCCKGLWYGPMQATTLEERRRKRKSRSLRCND